MLSLGGRTTRAVAAPLAVMLTTGLWDPGARAWGDEEAGTVTTLTMAACTRLARTRNPDLVSAHREREKADARVAEARSGALPAVGLNMGYTRNWIRQGSVLTMEGEDEEGNPTKETMNLTFGTPNLFTAGLTLHQSLYAGGKVRHALRAARIYGDQAQADVRSVENEVRFQVRRVFLGVLMAREAIAVAQLAAEQAEANLAEVRHRYGQGIAAEFDLLRAQVQAANLRPPLIEARNGYKRALEQLKHVIGLDSDEGVEVSGDLKTIAAGLAREMSGLTHGAGGVPRGGSDASPNTDLAWLTQLDVGVEQAVALATAERPEIRSIDFGAALLEQQIAVARGDRKPAVALFGSYGLQWLMPDEWRMKGEDVQDSWATGISLNFPLFDGGRSRAKVDQGRIGLLQLQAQRRKLVDGVRLQVKNALLDLQEAREKILAQQQVIGQAERGLSIADVRYRNGMSTQLEVLDAQLALTTARLQYVRALHDYALAVVSLEYAIGRTETQSDT